jgi:hypothetical protein
MKIKHKPSPLFDDYLETKKRWEQLRETSADKINSFFNGEFMSYESYKDIRINKIRSHHLFYCPDDEESKWEC